MKKIFILWCVSTLIFTAAGVSQTWKEYYDLLEKYINGIGVPRSLDSGIYYGEKALERVRVEVGEVDTNAALITYLLAAYYYQKQNFPRAESLWMVSRDIWKKTVNERHPMALETYSSLVNLIDDLGRHEEALELSHRLLQMRIEQMGEFHQSVGRNYTTLAVIYSELGRFSDVEPLLIKALSIYETCDPIPYFPKGLTYNIYGALKQEQHRLVEAESLFQKAITMFQLEFGERSMQEGMCISNIGDLYYEQGRYIEADSCFIRALGMWNAIDSTHFWIPIGMRNLADTYQKEKKYAEAESLYFNLIQRHTSQFKGDHPWIAEDLSSLANYYRDRLIFDKALDHYKRSLEIFTTWLPPTHENTSRCLVDMGILYRMAGKPEESFLFADSSFNNRFKNLNMLTAGLNENDAIQYSQSLSFSASHAISSFFDLTAPGMSQINKVADIILKTKGQITDEILSRNDYYSTMADSAAKKKLQNHRRLIEKISTSFLTIPDEDLPAQARKELDSLQANARLLEMDIAYTSKAIRHSTMLSALSVEKCISSLPKNAQMVEYLKYDNYDTTNTTHTPMYIAMVLHRNKKPSLVNIGEAGVVDSLIKEYQRQLLQAGKRISGKETNSENEYRHIARQIYYYVLKPLARYINEESAIFIAPDGDLNLVSFAGLIDDNGVYLIEKHPIHYLSAGRDLLRLSEKQKSNRGLFALGDPDYNALAENRISNDQQETAYSHVPSDPYSLRNVRSECDILRNLNLAPLPATRSEVDAVRMLWERKYSREISAVYLGADASEERFKRHAAGHRVIHLATHGFFLNPSCMNKSPESKSISGSQVFRENPLLESGLLLAGANLRGADADSVAGAEDGILTALEVSAMDLRGTDLVVLSACETGLGEVKGGEGVYGLRRAFQIAGAKTVISSLWQVPDMETMNFMKDLYSQDAATYPELMQKAMLKRIKELKTRRLSTHPARWAGFIATGDWRKR